MEDPFAGKSDEDLAADAARIREELDRRAEAAKVTFPLTWDNFRLYCTKDDRGTDADELNLPPAAARNFIYAGLELTFCVIIHENGDTILTHIRYPKTDTYIPLPCHMKLN